MQIAEEEYLRLRKPNDEEEFLGPEGGELFVVELIAPSEINR